MNLSQSDKFVLFYTSQIQAAEKESMEMQEKHSQLTEEKERLLNSLVEAEWVSESFLLNATVLELLYNGPRCLFSSSRQTQPAPVVVPLSFWEKMKGVEWIFEMEKLKGALSVPATSKSWEDIGSNDPSILVLDVTAICY